MRRKLLPGLVLLIAHVTQAQHEHHMPGMPMAEDSTRHPSHAYSLEAPMNRNASGTAWLPDSTPMFGAMHHVGKWMLMAHGNLFLRHTSVNFNNSDAQGADHRLDAPNWIMGMAQRRVGGNGLLAFTAMLSGDPFTVGGEGYPLLFQTGESWNGEPLVDRQHPHDLFSALSMGYTQRFSKDLELTGYVGYPGEPALGPAAFMHRISALSNPDAPLGHHWQDATHITFGVATLGLRYKWMRLEGSSFTGREPDEDRYGFDKPRFDSWSTRLSIAPGPGWSAQASTAFINGPEGLAPEVDVRRTTASVAHVTRAGKASWNTMLAWGLNDAGHDHREHSILLETARVVERGNTYLRYEFVQKSADELDLDELDHDFIANVHALTLGHSQRVARFAGLELFAGAQLTTSGADKELDPYYGQGPVSGSVYLRLTPQRMTGM